MATSEEQKNNSNTSSSDEDTDNDVPTLEEGPEGDGTGGVQSARGKLSRNEKKSRRALMKLGLKPYPGILRVSIKRQKSYFVIPRPEVYKHPTSDNYVIFGEAKMEDLNSQAHSEAAQRFTHAPNMKMHDVPETTASETKSKIEEIDEDAECDEKLFDPKDVQLVQSQAGCTRSQAIAALKKRNGDLIEAIMDMSSSSWTSA